MASVSAADNLTDGTLSISSNTVEIQEDSNSNSENFSFIDDTEDIFKENSSDYTLVLQNNNEILTSNDKLLAGDLDSTYFDIVPSEFYSKISVHLKVRKGGYYLKDTFYYYIDNDKSNMLNATNGAIHINLPIDTYHDITFVYNGNDKYAPCSATKKIYVKPSIFIQNSYYVDGGINIPYSIKYNNERNFSRTMFVPFGRHDVTFYNEYYNQTIKKTITVIKRILQTDNLTMNYQDTVEYKVRAADAGNNFISGLKLSFTIGDKTYQAVTEKQGYATFKIHIQAGCYNVTTWYCGVVNKNIINITPIYVDNAFKDMYINSVNTTPGVNKNITYGWKGNFKGSLQVYRSSSLIKSINLDTSEIIGDYLKYDNYSYMFSTSLLDLGDYDFKIVDKNGVVVSQSKVNIRKIPTEVYSYNTELIKNFKESISLHLFKKTGDEGITGRVIVKINGKSYNVNVKDGFGELMFKTPSKIKKYICTVFYDGDNIYDSSSSKFVINVVKADSDVYVSEIIKVKLKSKVTVKAKIYSHYGTKKVNSGIVKFKINGKIYKAKIKNGVAKVTIKTPAKTKTYNCKATYLGNKNIKASSTKFKIIVKKSFTKTIYSSQSTTKTTVNKKITKFTIVVPVKLNTECSESYGAYSVKTYKYLYDDYYGFTHSHVDVLVYKNGKLFNNFKAKYVAYTDDGKTITVNVNGNYWRATSSFNNVLNIYKVKATVWV